MKHPSGQTSAVKGKRRATVCSAETGGGAKSKISSINRLKGMKFTGQTQRSGARAGYVRDVGPFAESADVLHNANVREIHTQIAEPSGNSVFLPPP